MAMLTSHVHPQPLGFSRTWVNVGRYCRSLYDPHLRQYGYVDFACPPTTSRVFTNLGKRRSVLQVDATVNLIGPSDPPTTPGVFKNLGNCGSVVILPLLQRTRFPHVNLQAEFETCIVIIIIWDSATHWHTACCRRCRRCTSRRCRRVSAPV
jgi:hypothetical protein